MKPSNPDAVSTALAEIYRDDTPPRLEPHWLALPIVAPKADAHCALACGPVIAAMVAAAAAARSATPALVMVLLIGDPFIRLIP